MLTVGAFLSFDGQHFQVQDNNRSDGRQSFPIPRLCLCNHKNQYKHYAIPTLTETGSCSGQSWYRGPIIDLPGLLKKMFQTV